MSPASLGGGAPALLTDLYQLTMGQGYWKHGLAERPAAFHLFVRANPFGGGYTLAAGLENAMATLRDLRFTGDELDYLAGLRAADGSPLFETAFLDVLAALTFTADVAAVPEGTVIFPHQPLLRVVGPLLQAQLVETVLLNHINFQSLVATKAARVCDAARGGQVLEFGLRRAQGPDGGLSASRAAYIGGCAATSNVLAGMRYGIPVRGTHAHSWVQVFEDEQRAFEAYAEACGNNALFLVDTYDTLEGVRHAIEVGRRLRARGGRLAGIRLDSGDLAWLSRQARRALDEAGFRDALIVASNDLDEIIIENLVEQGARIDVWGVGTRLATAWGQPALGGVYKLTAVQDDTGGWLHKIKLSEQTIKISTPGILQVRRYRQGERFVADMLWDELTGVPPHPTIVDPADPTHRRRVDGGAEAEDLLVPIFAAGRAVYTPPPLDTVRERARRQLEALHPAIRRFLNPHAYPAGLEMGLHERKTRQILEARGLSNGEPSR